MQQEQPVEDLRNKIVEMNLDDRQEAAGQGEGEGQPWKTVQNRKGKFDGDDSSSSSPSEDGGGKSQIVQVFIPVVIYDYRPLDEVKEAIESRLGKIVYLSEGPTRTFESGREYNNLRLGIELNNSPEAKMLEMTYMKDERYDFYVDKMDQHFLKIFKGEQQMQQRKPTIDLGVKSLPTVVTPMGVVLPRAPFPRKPVAGETPRPILLKQQNVSYLSVAAGRGGGGGPAATVAPAAPPPSTPPQPNLASEDLFPQMQKVAKTLGRRTVSTQAREQQGETGMDISNDNVPEPSRPQQGVSFSAEQMRFLIEMGLVPSQTQQPPFRAPTETYPAQNPSAPSGPASSASGAYPPYYPYPYHPYHVPPPPPPPPSSYPYYYSPSPYGNPHPYPPPPQSYPQQQQYSQPFVNYSAPR